MAGKKQAIKQPTGTSGIEWVVAAIGTAVVVAAVGYMVWYGVVRPGGPPELTIRQVSEARQVEGSYLVQVEVENEGHSTAANVQIAGALSEGGVSVEESTASIDYVPQQSKRRAYFQFTKDPADHTLTLRVEGMAKP